MQVKLLGFINVDFDVNLLIVYCMNVCQILEKNWECSGTVHQIFIDFKIVYNLVNTEFLCSILSEFGILVELVRLIFMCLNDPYSRVQEAVS
jgi:hypothetical protein